MKKEYPAETVSEAQKKPKKKLLWILAAVAVLAVAVILIVKFAGGQTGPAVPEQEWVDVEATNYYNGVIEPQQTWEIQKDADRTIGEVYVSVGDTVTAGQELFTYDTSEAAMRLQQAQLELNGIQNEIDAYASQIKELTEQRANADADQQLEYTMQIQEQQSSQKQAQLNLQMKQVEVENLKKGMDNAVVTSTMDGVVKQINHNSSSDGSAFMTILATGAYQVKGTVDEINIWQFSEGMAVKVHSRVDESKVWDGTITKIDTENPAAASQNGGMMYGFEGDASETQATKYYFYVSLTTSDELLLGQHVYVEPLLDEADVELDETDGADTANEPADGGAEEGAAEADTAA